MIAAYYQLIILPNEVRIANKIRSKQRLDCIAYTDLVPNGYKGLTFFVNKKGQLCFYLTPAREFIKTDSKRIADWSLTNNSLNLSSIYIEDLDFQNIGFGYPNSKRHLSNGKENPLFTYRNDGYLFLMNKDYSEIEILVIQDGRNIISAHYQTLIDGQYDEILLELRAKAKPFFNYEMMNAYSNPFQLVTRFN